MGRVRYFDCQGNEVEPPEEGEVKTRMKVDSACIDHNVDRLVGEITGELYEWTDNDRMMATALGEIRGIHQLAEALKEVLRA